MVSRICIPSKTFEEIVQAYPDAVVEASASHKFLTVDGVEFSAPLAELDGAA